MLKRRFPRLPYLGAGGCQSRFLTCSCCPPAGLELKKSSKPPSGSESGLGAVLPAGGSEEDMSPKESKPKLFVNPPEAVVDCCCCWFEKDVEPKGSKPAALGAGAGAGAPNGSKPDIVVCLGFWVLEERGRRNFFPRCVPCVICSNCFCFCALVVVRVVYTVVSCSVFVMRMVLSCSRYLMLCRAMRWSSSYVKKLWALLCVFALLSCSCYCYYYLFLHQSLSPHQPT